jgi:adenosylcobinamide-phosphate synthase
MSDFPVQLLVFWLAILFDLTFGEPPNAIHPVAWLGRVIAVFQRLAPKGGRWKPFLIGALFVIGGGAAMTALGLVLKFALTNVSTPWSILGEAVALKFTFSIRGLARAGFQVQSALASNDIAGARRFLSWHLVSRDTSSLNESQVAAATIESLSENASDSYIAPFLCFAIAGLPGALVYRFINTCDAMLGYRDCEREWLGKSAARLDDLTNLVPSRLTAMMIIAGGTCIGNNPVQAALVWFRDRNLTASPNAGHPMSAAAGVLGIELEKVGHYRLGVGLRKPTCADISRAQAMLWCTALLAIVVTSAVLIA